jgi:putative phosphoribosyl transferase
MLMRCFTRRAVSGLSIQIGAAEQRELERRERQYRGERPRPNVEGRTVILVDDGLATGSTMRAAVEALRQEGAVRVVVAVPIAPPETCDAFREIVDDIVCAQTPEPFYAVGLWYEDFSQTSDEEVRELLEQSVPLPDLGSSARDRSQSRTPPGDDQARPREDHRRAT